MNVLALDVGSSSVRAQRFDERAEPVDELEQERYEGGDPDEIVRLVRKAIGARAAAADAVGSSCFGHTLLALAADGRPLTPVLGWRDTRSAALIILAARR
jgi:gluconokinase